MAVVLRHFDLGLARLQRLDPVKEASVFIEALATETGQSVAVAVWGNLGPTIVRLEEPIEPLHVNLRTGTVMSLANTATGRLFAAYLPPKVVERMLKDELVRQGVHGSTQPPMTPEAVEAALSETRRQGLSRSLGQPIPGIEHVISSNEVFHLKTLPKRIVIQGGGYIALEFACIFAGFGTDVTLIYRGENILRGFDEDVRSHVRGDLRIFT